MATVMVLQFEIPPVHRESFGRAMQDVMAKRLLRQAGPAVIGSEGTAYYEVVFHRLDAASLKAAGDLAQVAEFGMVLPDWTGGT